MGANMTEKAIGMVATISEAFEKQVKMHQKSTAHSHKSADDEQLISKDLRSIIPFKKDKWKSV